MGLLAGSGRLASGGRASVLAPLVAAAAVALTACGGGSSAPTSTLPTFTGLPSGGATSAAGATTSPGVSSTASPDQSDVTASAVTGSSAPAASGSASVGSAGATPQGGRVFTAAEQEIIARGRAYLAVTSKIAQGGKIDVTELNTVATPAWSATVAKNMTEGQKSGTRTTYPSGVLPSSPLDVQIKGATARLYLCIDERGATLLQDGQVLDVPPGTFTKRVNDLTLVQSSGVWKVDKLSIGALC